jgi:hypothetical protein
MVALVLRIDLQGSSKLVVAFEARTLFVALQCLLSVPVPLLRRCAFGLLLDPLTIASNEDLVLTGLFFFAGRGEMTRRHAWMTAYTKLLATRLSAWLFTLSWAVTLLLTFMRTTSESFAAYISTTNIGKPAWLVLQNILAA